MQNIKQEHQDKVKFLTNHFAEWSCSKLLQEEALQGRYSNTMRKKAYPSCTKFLDVHPLKHVLHIDAKNLLAQVEPGVTMEELVDACLPYGLIPQVVPEFKGISVGGAINGAAIESTSHRFGQFSDSCERYEILLGDGSVIYASAEQDSGLFYGISGSYGTLGIILGAEVKLVPTTGWVEVCYRRFESTAKALEFLSAEHRKPNAPDMLEALVFSSNRAVVIYGNHITQGAAQKLPQTSINKYWDNWFYSHADRVSRANKEYKEAMPIRDYLFRHDRGAFWMAGFAIHGQLLSHYWLHKLGLSTSKNIPHCNPLNPSALYRLLFGWIVKSQTLYGSLHNKSEEWFEKNFVIQDFYLPEGCAAEFADSILTQYRICPLWICPIRATNTPQLFSPHLQPQEKLLFNIGVYGIPFASDGPSAVKQMEETVYRMQGRKMFYCHCYLSQDAFWGIYPQDVYRNLRKRYGFENLLPDIAEKVLK